jgi:hypothetical protein
VRYDRAMTRWLGVAATVAAAAFATSCGGTQESGHPPVIGHVAAPPSNDQTMAGNYTCTISESGYTYPPFQCVIRRDGDHFQLAKLGGSQRFSGQISAVGDDWHFVGTFFCPYGDCTTAIDAMFVPDVHGGRVAHFEGSPPTSVRLEREYRSVLRGSNMVGGAAYGGAAYGGAQYGGNVLPQPRDF